jgi:hypothetical protein
VSGAKLSVSRALAVTILQCLWLPGAHAQAADTERITEQVSKQKAIYDSREVERPSGYVIDRSLLAYVHALTAEFRRSLASLGGADRWLDIGAGEGRAVLDYLASKYEAVLQGPQQRNGQKAQVVAMSIEDRRTPQWHEAAANREPKHVQYLFGKRLRDYSSEEIGQFQVITDVMGGFSYAQDLSLFMEKTLGFLTVNGSFYTVLQDVRSEDGANKPYYPNASYLTEIKNPDGSEVRMCSWLKSITCAEVICEFQSEWTPPVERYHIKKTCGDVRVPALTMTHFEAGTPPERKFVLKNPLASTLAGAQ